MQRGQFLHALAEIVHEALLDLLCAIALRDVTDDSDDRALSLRIQQTDPDLRGKFRPVRTPACKLAGDRPRRWRVDVRPSLRAMRSSESFWNDRFDTAAEQRAPRVSKQPLRLVVHSDDTPAVVDDEDGVGRRIDQTAEISLALVSTLDLATKLVVARCQ